MSRINYWRIGIVVLWMLTPAQAEDVGLWRFDADGKIAGQTADVIADSVGGHSGTAVNGPVYVTEIPERWLSPLGDGTNPNTTLHGGLTNALSLSLSRAASQYIIVPDMADLRMGSEATFTVEAAVKLATLPTMTSGRQWLVHKSTGADAATDFGVLVGGADLVNAGTWYNTQSPAHQFTGAELVLVFGSGAGLQTAVSNLQIPDTNWHYIMVSYDGEKNEVLFMLDYDFERIGNVKPGNVAGGGPLVIGGHGTGSGADETFDGLIDEVRLSNHALEGSPVSAGIPDHFAGIFKWYWTLEGGLPDGAYNTNGDRPWRLRSKGDLIRETGTDFWDTLAIAGEPGNLMLRIRSFGGASPGYVMWDHTSFGGQTSAIAPDAVGLAPGATLQMRFRIDDYFNGNMSDPARVHKWFRLETTLKGAAIRDMLMFGPASNDLNAHTGWRLYRNGNTSFPISGDLSQAMGWHVLHAAMFVDPLQPNAGVHHQTWLDGELVSDYFETAATTSTGPTLPNNDNNNSQVCDTAFDYIRFSADAAWDPQGRLLDRGEDSEALCGNGFDDDANGLTDCADPACRATVACKCYPHVLWADQDDDGDVDSADFGVFQACFSGADSAAPACGCLDRNNDGLVNRADFADYFIKCVGGPSLPVPAGCPR